MADEPYILGKHDMVKEIARLRAQRGDWLQAFRLPTRLRAGSSNTTTARLADARSGTKPNLPLCRLKQNPARWADGPGLLDSPSQQRAATQFLAAMNKCLAQSDKSVDGGKATKKRVLP
jgi:hypothetical protein